MLISSEGVVKHTDFGFAKLFGVEGNKAMSMNVGTLWYRAPEVLFGSAYYGPGIDIWGIGCIMGELILRAPLFQGTNELDQLQRIFAVLGTPDEEVWPGVTTLPNFLEFTPSSH
jgi:serine/threonine protein kinase